MLLKLEHITKVQEQTCCVLLVLLYIWIVVISEVLYCTGGGWVVWAAQEEVQGGARGVCGSPLCSRAGPSPCAGGPCSHWAGLEVRGRCRTNQAVSTSPTILNKYKIVCTYFSIFVYFTLHKTEPKINSKFWMSICVNWRFFTVILSKLLQ